MKWMIFLAAVAVLAARAPRPAEAQTLFEVEHARGNYRAGLVSEYDAGLLRTWGVPSGRYPDTGLLGARAPQKHGLKKQRMRAGKRSANKRQPN